IENIESLKESLLRVIALDLYSMAKLINNHDLIFHFEEARKIIFELTKSHVLSKIDKEKLLVAISSYKSEVYEYVKNRYLKDPTKELSISLAKSLVFDYSLPVTIKQINNQSHSKGDIYSKLIYYFDKNLIKKNIDGIQLRKLTIEDLDGITSNINNSYNDIKVSKKDVESLMNQKDFNSNLWIGAFNKDKLIGSIIGVFDKSINEIYLEWIQVDKEFRRTGIGESLLVEFLNSAKKIGDFVTVCCNYNNQTRPIELYKKVGFINQVNWFVRKW
ncbi:GNAT family N-acetyltransferase, partial [Acholeplasma sp. OttesenSCG-928-E16]|nr:GNAT family N-acetyltransferase [Acholeplasma sp. OttesenSCG-928-E16]